MLLGEQTEPSRAVQEVPCHLWCPANETKPCTPSATSLGSACIPGSFIPHQAPVNQRTSFPLFFILLLSQKKSTETTRQGIGVLLATERVCQRNCMVRNTLALHDFDLSSILGTPHGSLTPPNVSSGAVGKEAYQDKGLGV